MAQLIEAFDVEAQQQTKLALFASDHPIPTHATDLAVQVRLAEFSIQRPRQWGACWIFFADMGAVETGGVLAGTSAASREHTSWHQILLVLCAYRWIDPGSEWRLHREWYAGSAMGDLLNADFALAAKR